MLQDAEVNYGVAPGLAQVAEALAHWVVNTPGPFGVKVLLPESVLRAVVSWHALPGELATVMLDMYAATAEFM